MSDRPGNFTASTDAELLLRRAFGRFGTGVTVVTVKTATGPMGMTANSFSSVSLDPALVLWCPALSSSRHAPFVEAPNFTIHILAADQREMADHFARHGDGFEAFDWHESPLGSPHLTGTLAALHCRTHAIHPAGDHSIVIGQVDSMDFRDDDRPGLLFERGTFGRILPDAQ